MKLTKNEMTRRVVFLDANDDLQKAHVSMRAMEMHHVPVMSKGKVIGMISDRDVLAHGRVRGKDLLVPKKKVAEILSGKLVTCHPDSSIAQVAELMLKHGVHAIPVIDSKKTLVGIITSTDLIRLLKNMEWGRDLPMPFRFEAPVRLIGLAS